MIERILTAILSTLLPGAGQLMQHRWMKGVAFLGAAMVLSGVVRRETLGQAAVLSLRAVLIALALWSATDAFMLQQAKAKKK
ncbi:MAG: hypothetical protein EPO39_10455 [Candidatus Manganitrophaceae bacterium]|nr:MAG: hypothetical protein EPO39_10455 [Candidatus Manganitrophaceae bacterium]